MVECSFHNKSIIYFYNYNKHLEQVKKKCFSRNDQNLLFSLVATAQMVFDLWCKQYFLLFCLHILFPLDIFYFWGYVKETVLSSLFHIFLFFLDSGLEDELVDATSSSSIESKQASPLSSVVVGRASG